MAKEIPLTQGKTAIVDDNDYEKLASAKWQFSTTIGYAVGQIPLSDGTYSKKVLMHRYIFDTPANKVMDHINGNKLDNRRSNLRICTRGENNRNIKIRSTNKTGVKGVYPHCSGKFQVHVRLDGKSHYLGLVDDLKTGGILYDFWAVALHGEFANLNYIDGEKRKIISTGC